MKSIETKVKEIIMPEIKSGNIETVDMIKYIIEDGEAEADEIFGNMIELKNENVFDFIVNAFIDTICNNLSNEHRCFQQNLDQLIESCDLEALDKLREDILAELEAA